jgi:DNA-binding transcriptional LysR family regulator
LRYRNNIRITDAGKLLYDKFKHHEIYLNESIQEIQTKQSSLKGILRVTLPIVISKNIISPFLGAFLKKYPQIDLIVSYQTSNIELLHEGVDVAITITPPKSKNSASTLLKKYNLQLYATPNFLEKRGPITTIEKAIQYSTIGYLTLDGMTIDDFIATNLITGERVQGRIKHPRIYIDNLIHIAELARSGDMMVTAWDSVIQKELNNGELVKILPEWSFREISCYLVRPSITCSALQHVFSEFIEECFKNSH